MMLPSISRFAYCTAARDVRNLDFKGLQAEFIEDIQRW